MDTIRFQTAYLIGYIASIEWKKLFFLVFLYSALSLSLLSVSTYVYFAKDLASKDIIVNKSSTGLILLDDSGEPFFTFYNAKPTEYIPIESIPLHTQQAVVAGEDRDYYNHSGFSVRGIARAVVVNIKNKEIVQGGSTIPQELVKISLLNSKKSFLRKWQELILSIELTRRYSKEEILEMFLNSVYFGEGAFGIQNAALNYFNKEAKDLTLAESAMLAGLLPAPSVLSPKSNDPQPAIARQKFILSAMKDLNFISLEESNKASAEPLSLSYLDDDLNELAPHFALYVRNILIERYGEENIIRSGYKVRTTINKHWQKRAEEALTEQVAKLRKNDATNGAVVMIDPKKAEIIAMVGSHDWFDPNNGKINMALAPRQPGSSFKPIIFSKALDEKLITASTILKDKPVTYDDGYKPKNYDKRFRGNVTVRRALANSLNVPAVEVLDKFGVRRAITAARSFNLSSLSSESTEYGVSFVLGSKEVSLLEISNAYAVFANEGVYKEATPIKRIEDKFGNPVYEFESSEKRILSSGAAYIITSILSDRRTRAEVFGNSLNTRLNAAVKTGTSQDYRDALTIGYTPDVVIGVWVGNNDNKPMDSVAGSLGAAPVWKTLMNEYSVELDDVKFPVPDTVVRAKGCHLILPEKNDEGDETSDSDEKEEDNDGDPVPQLVYFEEYYLKGTEDDACDSRSVKLYQKLEEERLRREEEEKEEDDDDDD